MKVGLITLLTLLTISAFAQKNRFGASLEIAPSATTVVKQYSLGNGPVNFYMSENIFAKGFYGLADHIDVTSGVGYLNTKQFQSFPFGFTPDAERTEDFVSHQYLTIPAGLNFHFGSFFINPEIGAAIAVGHLTVRTTYETHGIPTGTITIGSISAFNSTKSPLYKKVTMPLMLSFGGEVKVGICKILFGAKTYYSLNKLSTFNDGKYLGVGFMTGVKF